MRVVGLRSTTIINEFAILLLLTYELSTSRHVKYKRLKVGNGGVPIMLIKHNYSMGEFFSWSIGYSSHSYLVMCGLMFTLFILKWASHLSRTKHAFGAFCKTTAPHIAVVSLTLVWFGVRERGGTPLVYGSLLFVTHVSKSRYFRRLLYINV